MVYFLMYIVVIINYVKIFFGFISVVTIFATLFGWRILYLKDKLTKDKMNTIVFAIVIAIIFGLLSTLLPTKMSLGNIISTYLNSR